MAFCIATNPLQDFSALEIICSNRYKTFTSLHSAAQFFQATERGPALSPISIMATLVYRGQAYTPVSGIASRASITLTSSITLTYRGVSYNLDKKVGAFGKAKATFTYRGHDCNKSMAAA